MQIEVYLFLSVMAWVTMFASLILKSVQREAVILPFLCAFMFFFLALNSFTVERQFCNANETLDWSCYKPYTTDIGMGIFNSGLGLLMLIFAIYTVIKSTSEEIEDSLEGAP